MNNWNSDKQKLDSLFEKAKGFSDNPELQAEWAKYLCVRVSGLIEVAIQSILAKYVEEKAHPNIQRYVENDLDNFQNPNTDKIFQLLNSFNKEWAKMFEKETEGQLHDSIATIVNNRHQIAHGGNIGLTYLKMRNHYKDAIDVIKLIERICS